LGADFYPVWSFTYSGSNLAGKNIQHGLDRLNLPQNSLHNAGADTAGPADLAPRFVCGACGKRGAEVRPDFHWNAKTGRGMGYR
jgi:hypothetical protein